MIVPMTTTNTATSEIRFLRHSVTNGSAKCRVHYSYGDCYVEPTGNATRKAVTIYAKGYLDRLGSVFGDRVINDSDGMTDHFEVDRVHIYEDDPLFAAAKAANDECERAHKEHREKVQAKRAARPRLELQYNRDGSRTLYNKRNGERFAINGVDTFATIDDTHKALLAIGMRISRSDWQPVSATKRELADIAAYLERRCKTA